jgi:hypothetical protein
MRLRIAAAACVGVVLIGILCWPLAEPAEPLGVVCFGKMSAAGVASLAGVAFVAGLIGYFVSWPYGRQIGILAVPFGLAVWAIRSGDISNLMEQNPNIEQRQAIFSALRWEAPFWLALVGAGFAGVWLAQKMLPAPTTDHGHEKPKSNSNKYLNTAIALIGTVLIAQFLIRIFVQDIRAYDSRLGLMVGQPAVGQIAFGVMMSFGISAFIVKKFLCADYIWPSVASAFVTAFAVSTYAKPEVLKYMLGAWPAAFYGNSVVSVSPLQMVAFGVLGAVAGYWMAVRYGYWRRQS